MTKTATYNRRPYKQLFKGVAANVGTAVHIASRYKNNSNRRRIFPKTAPKPKKRKVLNIENSVKSQDVFDLQRSFMTVKHSTPLSKYVTVMPPLYQQYLDQQTFTGAQGSQYFYQLPRFMGDRAQLDTLNQALSTTATTETQYWFDHFYQTTMITNFSSEVNELTIWDLIVKDDIGAGFGPENCIQAGYNSKYNNTAAYIRPFNSPLESVQFNKYYKVEKKTKVVLKPSECHKHIKYVEYKKKYVSSYGGAGQAGSGGIAPVYLKGWTRLTFIQANGVAVTSGTGVTSMSKVEHAVVQTTSIKFYTPQGPVTNQVLGTVSGILDSSTAMKNDNPFTKLLTLSN